MSVLTNANPRKRKGAKEEKQFSSTTSEGKENFTCSCSTTTLPAHKEIEIECKLHKKEKGKRKPLFNCCNCQKVYTNKKSFEIHVEKCCADTKITCIICDKLFTKKGSVFAYENHRRYHRYSAPYMPVFSTNDGPLFCVYCDGADSQKENDSSQSHDEPIKFTHNSACRLNNGNKNVKVHAMMYLGSVVVNDAEEHIWGQFT